jgi:hypothetical protein
VPGVELCEPCPHLQQLTRPGIIKDLIHRGGLRADSLPGGTIRVGDKCSRCWDCFKPNEGVQPLASIITVSACAGKYISAAKASVLPGMHGYLVSPDYDPYWREGESYRPACDKDQSMRVCRP